MADPFADAGKILSLWKENLPDSSKSRFSRVYQANTGGRSWVWLATASGEGIHIGTTGLCSREISVNGCGTNAGVAMDFAVQQAHRGLGPAMKLQRAVTSSLQDKEIDFIYAFPSDQASSVFRFVGYETVGAMTRWAKILSSREKLKATLENSFAARVASAIVDRVSAYRSVERTYKAPDGLIGEDGTAFDERFDSLWRVARRHFTIIGDRSSAYLNWRYPDVGSPSRSLFTVSTDSGTRLLGFVVYLVRDSVAHVEDLLVGNPFQDLDYLLGEFVAQMRKRGVHVITLSYIGNKTVVDRLVAWGFVAREVHRTIMVFVNGGYESAPFLLDPQQWHLLNGDDI